MISNTSFESRLARTLLCGASIAALVTAVAGQAQAQGSASATSGMSVENVTVSATGTLIKGITATGSNMISVNVAEMKQGGALTTNQILGQVPQLSNAFNTNVASPTAGNFSGFRPQIRSIPSQNIVGGSATLLLLDGHNMVGVSALGTAPDASAIPTVVLQRVDVLPDGASATYGANAITGVINFITRDRFDGLQISAHVGAADSYSSFDISAIGGTSWGSGSAYVAIQHTDNTVLMGGDRDYTSMDLTGIGGRDSRSTTCALPNIVAGGQNYAQTGYPSNTPGSLAANVSGPYGGLDPVTNAGSLNRCDTNADTSIFPSLNQTGIFGSFRQEIGDNVVFTTKVLWNSRRQFSLHPQAGSTQTITNANPFFQSIAGETSQRIQFDFAPYIGNNRKANQNSVQVFQITPQLTAALPFKDWEVVVSGNYGRSDTSTFNTGGLDSVLLNQAITTGVSGNYFDPYNIGLTDKNLLNEILGRVGGGWAHQHLVQAQVSIDGTMFELPGGPVKVAFGARYDWEDYVANLSVYNIVPTQTAAIHRVVTSTFGEIHVPLVGADNAMPLVHSLQFDISGRIDNYSVFGSTANFKLGFSWKPFDELTIRGTRGTSYDAPSLADTSAPDGRYQLVLHNTPNAFVPPGTSLADSLRPSILVPGGNPNLGPELGSTWSLGADFQPNEIAGVDFTGLDLGVTYYRIAIEHQIGLLYHQLQLFTVPNYRDLYILNPTPAQAAPYGYSNLTNFPGTTLASAWGPGQTPPYILYDARRNNLGNSVLSGLDFSAHYTTDLDIGTLSTGITGTYSLQNDTAGSAAGPFLSIQTYSVPLYTAAAFAQFNTGPWNMRASLQFTPGFRVDPTTQAYSLYGQRRIGSFATVNLHVGYDLSNMASWLDQTVLGLTVNNAFDAVPPIYLHGGPDLPPNSGVGIVASGSTLGRYFLMSLQKSF